MVQFIDDLATYLQTNGHGTKGTDLFKGNAPSSPEAPDNLVVVTDTGGTPNVDISGVELITVQVRARNKRQEKARDDLLAIQSTLHQTVQADLGTYTIISAIAADRPAVIGRDEKERWNLVSNYEIQTRLS